MAGYVGVLMEISNQQDGNIGGEQDFQKIEVVSTEVLYLVDAE